MTDIQRQFARNITSIDDLSVQGPQLLLVSHFTQEMQALRKKYAKSWSDSSELNLQGATIYLLAHCLVLAENQGRTVWRNSDTNHFIAVIMQQGHDAALRLISIFQRLGLASAVDPACAGTKDGGAPLLAHQKYHFRLAFQACLFLLKYLDHNITASQSDQDAARNAVMAVYQIFKQHHSREEFQRAARTLEVLSRAMVLGGRRIKSTVKSGMGASLNYNAIWTAASLRGSE